MIRICQCLCPARHCILAIAYQEGAAFDDSPPVDLKHLIAFKTAYGLMNPWCGICRAREPLWTYEDNPTRFESMEEALPELRRLEREQAGLREVLGGANQN